ncbi:MAG: phosphotransferase [Acidobacteriota bacterium]
MPSIPQIQELLARAGRSTVVEATEAIASHSGSGVMVVRSLGETYIAKVGSAAKLRAEVEKYRSWPATAGRGRRILAEIDLPGGEMAFLGEYLSGTPLAELFRDAGRSPARAARSLADALHRLWRATVTAAPAPLVYSRDIEDRLVPLLVHRPELAPILGERLPRGGTGRQLLDRLAAAEPALRAPMTVHTHGDLTPDNVLFDEDTGAICFLDLARSGPGDPLLDVGKFVAACVREELLGRELPAATEACSLLCEAAGTFCASCGDRRFAARLAISTARTLLGSARLPPPRRAATQIRRGLSLLEDALGA